MAFYITGDTHGVQNRILSIEQESGIKAGDYLVICGDFGYLFSNTISEQRFLDDWSQRGYTVLFVDGNHECFPALFSYKKELWNGGYVHRIRDNIYHLMRGQVYDIEGKTFFTMGGAYSTDRYMRTLGKSYWEEEIPTRDDYVEAAKNLKANGMSVNYILTHTAPQEMIRRLWRKPNGHDAELTGFLEFIMNEVKFDHWFCGHWHEDKDFDDNFSFLWYNIKKL